MLVVGFSQFCEKLISIRLHFLHFKGLVEAIFSWSVSDWRRKCLHLLSRWSDGPISRWASEWRNWLTRVSLLWLLRVSLKVDLCNYLRGLSGSQDSICEELLDKISVMSFKELIETLAYLILNSHKNLVNLFLLTWLVGNHSADRGFICLQLVFYNSQIWIPLRLLLLIIGLSAWRNHFTWVSSISSWESLWVKLWWSLLGSCCGVLRSSWIWSVLSTFLVVVHSLVEWAHN